MHPLVDAREEWDARNQIGFKAESFACSCTDACNCNLTALQAHFFKIKCKMVAIKNLVAKKKENVKGRRLHDILHITKKGKTLHDIVHEWLMRRTTRFHHFYSATVSLRIHVEFLNDERGKEKDR